VKKSASIHLTLMASMALVSCGQSRRCADPAGQIVPDAMCAGPAARAGYHWIYAGRSSGTRGTAVHSGAAPSQGGVSRGGLGAHGSASAGAHGGSGS